ncbi:MAG: very short patch repair endonuclease [Tetrasphaera sp.]
MTPPGDDNRGNFDPLVAEGSEPAFESWAVSPERRRNMQANRSRDTKPELRVRQRLHARGLRYRVAVRPEPTLPRRADIVFTRQRVVVFIDGCFWHGCPEHGRTSFSRNETYWNPKILRTKERDQEVDGLLTSAGWTVLRFWEHDDVDAVVSAVEVAVRGVSSDGRVT